MLFIKYIALLLIRIFIKIYILIKNIKIISFNIILFLHSIYFIGQNSNPYFNELDKIKSQKIDSLISFNTDKNKLKYLALLPSVNYDFLNNKFNLGISISNLSNFYQNKQRNKIELERLKFQLLEKKENYFFQLEKEYELIQDTYELLSLELNNTTLTTEIFNLKKAQYENNKINLEEWLNVQKNHQDRNLVIFAKRKSLISKMKQFQVKIRSEIFKIELDHLLINTFK